MFRMRRSVLTPLAALLLSSSTVLAQQVVPLWPHQTPEPAQTTEAEVDVTKPTDALISGHRTARLANVTKPTMTVYAPPGNPTTPHAAALVFPGGGYVRLAWDGEGLDTCKWLNTLGVTCLLVKYRVPEAEHYPDNYADLEDAQQAMRLARTHATEWHLNPAKIGVVGFSAGGNLGALLSTHPDETHVESTPAAPDVNPRIDARANFAILGYPAYLAVPPTNHDLNPVYLPNAFTPPTFLIAAENDRGYGFNALVYYRALLDAKVPAELHMYSTGGHGFGLHPVGSPEEHWTQQASLWLHSLGMLPAGIHKPVPGVTSAGWTSPNGTPCPAPPAPVAGSIDKATAQQIDPACW